MTWARLDDGFWRNPKVTRCSDHALGLHVRAISYCADQTTNGELDRHALKMLRATGKRIHELVSNGLWDTADAGYTVHDYLKYNPSAQELDDRRASKAMAGAKGAASRWHGGENAPVPVPVPDPLKTSSTAREADLESRLGLAETYYRTFGHDPTKDILDEMEHTIVPMHPPECIKSVLRDVGGLTPDKRSFRTARFKFKDCETERTHHHERVGARTNGVRAGSRASYRTEPGEQKDYSDFAAFNDD